VVTDTAWALSLLFEPASSTTSATRLYQLFA